MCDDHERRVWDEIEDEHVVGRSHPGATRRLRAEWPSRHLERTREGEGW